MQRKTITNAVEKHVTALVDFFLMEQVVLCIFCIINSLLTLTRAFSFAFGGLRAAIQVHDSLLKKLIDAPINFFDQTPSGRILNRQQLMHLRDYSFFKFCV